MDDYTCQGQMNIFDFLTDPPKDYKITKPIRLIELFAGIGAQAKALERLGADFEHYRVIEFDEHAIKSYNAIHKTDFQAQDIRNITGESLAIKDVEKYTYLLTYSFPCQDLSVAGKQRGMQKGSGTRSGLLWEVERILGECEYLPEVLLMENVPQVHGYKFIDDFKAWCIALENMGYSNFWQDLNSKDYGVAQSRNRTFMVSILGTNVKYEFPKPFELTKTMADYLEDHVDEKYYISNERARILIEKLVRGGTDEIIEKYGNDKINYKPFDKAISYPLRSQDFARTGFMKVAPTLSARDYKDPKRILEELDE